MNELQLPLEFLERLGATYPIIQAPMGGGPTTPELVAAVSNAGGLGFLAAGYLRPEELREQVQQVRSLTDRPFGVNVFIDGSTEGADDVEPMLALLRRWSASLGTDIPSVVHHNRPDLQSMIRVVLEMKVPVVSTTFGVPDPDALRALHSAGVIVLGTATTVNEALELKKAGVDAVIAQGAEAGAHRASFLPPIEYGAIGTMALVPQVIDAVSLPVIASGGIMDGRGIVAAIALGAVAVQMGTAFLVSDEAALHDAYRNRLLTAREDETAITRAFSGRPARGIRNRFMTEVEEGAVPVPPYPVQNDLTGPIRRAAAQAGNADALSLWAGQGLRLIRPMPAGRLTRILGEEIERSLAALCNLAGFANHMGSGEDR